MYCFDLEKPFKSEKYVSAADLSNSLPATNSLSEFTKDVLKQSTQSATTAASDRYKRVGNTTVYFYEFAKSVACSEVNLPNVIVQNWTLNDLLGFDRSELKSVFESYSPCMKVVPLEEHQHQMQQYQQQMQHQYQQYSKKYLKCRSS